METLPKDHFAEGMNSGVLAISDVRADSWFRRVNAEKYHIRESCFRTRAGSVLVLPWRKDEQQLIGKAQVRAPPEWTIPIV